MATTSDSDKLTPCGLECPRGHSHMVYVREVDADKFTDLQLARCPNVEGDDDDGWGDTEDPETH
jgi:hypothetical protein